MIAEVLYVYVVHIHLLKSKAVQLSEISLIANEDTSVLSRVD